MAGAAPRRPAGRGPPAPAHFARLWALLGESVPASDPEAALRVRLAPFGPPEARRLRVPVRFERTVELHALAATFGRPLPAVPRLPFGDALGLLLLSVRRPGP